LRQNPPCYLDVGARGGLSPRWQLVYRAGLIRPAFVEPDSNEANRLSEIYPDAIVLPVALGAVDGEQVTLHVTVQPGCSSLRRPDVTQPIVESNPDFDVIKTIRMNLTRLDTVWDRAAGPINFIKIDVQGYELEVLKGCDAFFDDFLCLELEVTFKPLYVGQPLFNEIYAFVNSRGFDLVKLAPTSLFEFNQIVECNAYFVRHDAHNRPEVAMWKQVNDVGDFHRVITWGY
jgi:FkbM family methyltransferase